MLHSKGMSFQLGPQGHQSTYAYGREALVVSHEGAVQGTASGTTWTACCWRGDVAHCQCAVTVLGATQPLRVG